MLNMKINIKTLKDLFEQASQEALAASPAPTPEAQPQVQQPPTTPPAQPQNNPQSQTSGGVVTVEKIVDHLNGIRSGKSFNDPLVFTAITNIFNGLSSSERAVLDKALSQLDKSIDQITKQQSPPNPNNQEVKGPTVQPQMNAPGNGIPNGLQGPQQVQQMMSSSPAAGMMSGVLAENAYYSKKNYVFPNSLRSSKRAYNNSFFELAKGKEDLVAEIILKALKRSSKNVNLVVKETLNGLTKNQLIGEYVKSILKGTVIMTISQDSILKLFLNLETVLKFVEETKDKKYLEFKGEERVVKAIFDNVSTQDAFTEEKTVVEDIVHRAFNEIKKTDTDAEKKEMIIKIIKNEISGIESDSFAIYDKLSSLSESINSPNKSTMIVVNGKEVPFGSEEHLGQLTIVLNGLDSLKSCYRKGSSARSTLAGACQRIRKILNDSAGGASDSVQPLMVTTDKE